MQAERQLLEKAEEEEGAGQELVEMQRHQVPFGIWQCSTKFNVPAM